jgi:hypothetical protein
MKILMNMKHHNDRKVTLSLELFIWFESIPFFVSSSPSNLFSHLPDSLRMGGSGSFIVCHTTKTFS